LAGGSIGERNAALFAGFFTGIVFAAVQTGTAFFAALSAFAIFNSVIGAKHVGLILQVYFFVVAAASGLA
jgi:hypothetical protein